jgi:hypothetical protein
MYRSSVCYCVTWAIVILLTGMLLPTTGQAGPILGQIDTFENNTTNGWMIGDPLARNPPVPGFTPPAVIPTGGPAGAGDHFMLLTADDVRSGGRITVFNRDQWGGNFLQAGVNLVEVDLKNFNAANTDPLPIRIAIKAGTGRGSTGYSSTTPFLLPADGQWHHAAFLLDAADLTAVGAAPPLNTLLANVAEFRILNSPTPLLNGTDVNAQVGVDNIAALASPLAIPEPGSFSLLLTGVAGVGTWGWLCRRRRG